jgi:hypothetical protein
MNFRLYLLLYSISLVILSLVASAQTAPGYMDAEYYFAGGLQLLNGQGFSEPYLWNYLSDPQGLPGPSHTYWMPLASILSAFGMIFSGAEAFSAARLPFILLAASLAPLTAALSYSLRPHWDLALLAGILASISGFYLPFLSTTATFAPFMFLGALFFLLSVRLLNHPPVPGSNLNRWNAYKVPFFLGVIAGLMYFTRSDGLLYLLLASIVAIIHARNIINQPETPNAFSGHPLHGRNLLITDNLSLKFQLSRIPPFMNSTFLVLVGFLIPTFPWFIRNAIIFSSPFPPGVSRLLWLTNYDQTFTYPASLLTFDHWWASGLTSILQARVWSLGQNLQTTLGVQGMIFLLPLILIAMWRLRKEALIKLAVLAYVLTLVVMTLAIPFAGARGGFFHAGAAFQPLFWALAPIGLEAFVSWGSRLRGWVPAQALQVFSLGIVALALLLTGLTTLPRLLPEDGGKAPWNRGQSAYQRLEAALDETGALPGEIVMVNNPPGYYLASGRPAIVIPYGDPNTTLAASERYGARYLLLDRHHPKGLKNLYEHPGNLPGLLYLTTFENTHIFSIQLLKNEQPPPP